MRIAFFTMHYPSLDGFSPYDRTQKIGGAENVAYNLAKDLARKGHEVNVYTTTSGRKFKSECSGSLSVRRYPADFRFESANLSMAMLRDMFFVEADVVHSHFTIPPIEFAAALLSKLCNAPLVLTYHGDAMETYGSVKRRLALSLYNKVCLPLLLRGATRIIVPSKHYIAESKMLKGVKRKIITINNGIKLEHQGDLSKEAAKAAIGVHKDSLMILCIAALIPYKGLDVLIAAYSDVARANTICVIAGTGPLEKKLREQGKTEYIKGQLKFVGFINDEQKDWYYAAADMFVLPSVGNTEVLPMVLLEASANALPLVVSDLPTLKEIVRHGCNALVVERGNHEMLGNALSRLLEDSAMRERLGTNALRRVEASFQWRDVVDRTECLYESILTERLVGE